MEVDSLSRDIYWENDSVLINSEDTFSIYRDGDKIVFWKPFCLLPDSIGHYLAESDYGDTCYIYATKRKVAFDYSFDEIREKKLYDRMAVAKKDFHNRIYEYRTKESSNTH